jgi:hypothetical protein
LRSYRPPGFGAAVAPPLGNNGLMTGFAAGAAGAAGAACAGVDGFAAGVG